MRQEMASIQRWYTKVRLTRGRQVGRPQESRPHKHFWSAHPPFGETLTPRRSIPMTPHRQFHNGRRSKGLRPLLSQCLPKQARD